MCHQCQTNPVYEFTNQRKLCKTCFIHWFYKKFLYTLRKFGMVKRGEIIGYFKKNDFRSAVLEELLKMFSAKGTIKLVNLSLPPAHNKNARSSLTRVNLNSVNNKISQANLKSINTFKNFQLKQNKIIKIVLEDTSDSVSDKLIHSVFEGDLSKLKERPIEDKIIRPLYLFLDKEILLYAMLKKLNFKEKKYFIHLPLSQMKEVLSKAKPKDKISNFIEELEKKHPEIKHSIVNSYLEIN